VGLVVESSEEVEGPPDDPESGVDGDEVTVSGSPPEEPEPPDVEPGPPSESEPLDPEPESSDVALK
jgi:hypothetical protein